MLGQNNMKHLKLFEGFENIDTTGLIRAWLSAIGIEENNFIINPDWSISTNQSVEIPGGFLTKIPIKFKSLDIEDAYFQCEDNNLKTLENIPDEGPDVEITYNDNPCWDDINQLKWINPVWMSKGIIWNQKEQGFNTPYQFVFSFKVLDAYWDDILKEQPELFKNLKTHNTPIHQSFSIKSNQISEKLYNKYKYLARGNKSGLLSLNK